MEKVGLRKRRKLIKDKKEYFELPCGCKFPILGEEKEDDGYPSTEIDYYNLPDCPITWDLLRSGETLGVFQLDTNTGQKWAAKVKPENIGEVADLSALLRPGAAESMMEGVSMSEHYVLRKFGKEENRCQFSVLEPILSRTYNVLLYQEQIISIATLVAGFSLTEGDDIRKAVGGKKAEKLKEAGELFIEKADKHGVVSRAEAEEIFNWIKSSARYLFNQCLSPESKVTSDDGSKTLDEVEVGEYIDTPEGYSKVLNKFEKGEQELFLVKFSNGNTIKCTLSHEFLCADGIKRELREIIDKDFEVLCDG